MLLLVMGKVELCDFGQGLRTGGSRSLLGGTILVEDLLYIGIISRPVANIDI